MVIAHQVVDRGRCRLRRGRVDDVEANRSLEGAAALSQLEGGFDARKFFLAARGLRAAQGIYRSQHELVSRTCLRLATRGHNDEKGEGNENNETPHPKPA